MQVWASRLHRISRNSGGLEIIAGSHRSLIGDSKKGISSELVESGILTEEELKRAESIQLEPGEFIIFHSWFCTAVRPTDLMSGAPRPTSSAPKGHLHHERDRVVDLLAAQGS